MMSYKVTSSLDMKTVDSIRIIQKDLIMDTIQKHKESKSFTLLSPLKIALMALIVLAIVIPLTINIGNGPSPTPIYTIEDVYEKLLDYQARLETVDFVQQEETPIEQYNKTGLIKLAEMTKVYQREDLEEIYSTQVLNVEQGEYLESFFDAEMFLDNIIDMIENNQDIPLDEYVIVDESLYGYNKFKFTYVGEDYVVIKALNSSMGIVNYRTGYKIGLTDDKVDLKTIHYSFDPTNWLEDDALKTNFNYMDFLQDNHIILINSLEEYYTLNYLSLDEGRSISISRGLGVNELEDVEEGYVFNLYDAETKVGTYINISDNIVLGEAYTIFDDKGFVFTYGDYDMSDDNIMIIWNLLLAEGWDQIVVPSSSGYGYMAQGLYLDGVLLDITGNLQVVKNNTMAHVTLRQYLLREELSDAAISMNGLPLTWTLTYPTLAYIDSIRISDMETLISMSQIDGLDFFTEDIKQELYNYLDEDIKNIIE